MPILFDRFYKLESLLVSERLIGYTFDTSIHKSLNQNPVLEFPLILNPLMLLEPGHCIFSKFSIGILTHNFMNSEHSGILYCLIWAHELLSRQIPVDRISE